MPKFYSNINFKSFGSNSVSSNVAVDSSGVVIKGSTSGTGGTGGTTKIEREKIIFVDPINGNDTTAATNYSDNNFVYPYQTYANALLGATSGYTIVMLPGTYTGAMFLKDGVTIYCEPGVNITDGGFICDKAMTSEVLGHAKFTGTSSYNAFDVYTNSAAYISNLTFEFDTITGIRHTGIYHQSDGTLTVRGNSIFCSRPIRILSNTKNVNINIKNFIKSYDIYILSFGTYFGGAPYPKMAGEIIVTCPLIETTNTANFKQLVNFGEALRHSDPGAYKIIINAKLIKASTASISEPYPYYSGVVFIGGGDNIHIYGNIIGNKIHCVSAPSLSGVPHTGTIYFYGDMESDIPVISLGTKSANGNGWHNISVNGGYLKTKGTAGLGVIETTNNWNNIMGGVPGVLHLNNCILHNETVDSNILEFNQPFSYAFLRNCILYSPGTTGWAASSVQSSKTVNYTNTRSNKNNKSMIVSNLSSPSFTYDPIIDIPKINS
jgi:hypothetical protein